MRYFYIEFRFHRYPKSYLRGLINEIAHEFKVKGALRYRPVPHMTLYGPAQTKSLQNVLLKIEKVAKKYTLVPFKVDSFGWHNEKSRVVAAQITASEELKNLRRELAEELIKISIPQPWDSQSEYWFHSTIAFKDIDHKFNQIWRYLNEKDKPYINQYLVRITVLNRQRKIEWEYDLMFQRWLNRREALSRHLWRQTINRLRELQGLPPERRPPLLDWFRRIFNWRK